MVDFNERLMKIEKGPSTSLSMDDSTLPGDRFVLFALKRPFSKLFHDDCFKGACLESFSSNMGIPPHSFFDNHMLSFALQHF